MAVIRSVLWIGRGERFAAEMVADAPTLDVVWERDARRAASLSPASFHAVVLDAESVEEAREGLVALGSLRQVPVLVRLDRCNEKEAAALRSVGAADVSIEGESGAGGHAPGLALPERLERLVRDATPARRARPRRTPAPVPGLIGDGPQMQEIFALVAVAARTRATVLLSGETGTGKELVARAVHRGSPRRAGPFVALNCAAFPDTLLESELFGHVKGSFTGADRDKPGLFEAAHGGTLFLDEVGETTPPLQAKLLRVLQEREVRPVGGARTRSVDVRVIAASNRDLADAARRGAFREDLYYRLAVFPIRLPPLRERARDVLPLARHFLALHGPLEGKPDLPLSAEAARLLAAHRWPGNVRELENEIQRALALAEPGEPLTPAHFSERLSGILEPIEANLRAGETLRETVGRIEAWLIRRALERNGKPPHRDGPPPRHHPRGLVQEDEALQHRMRPYGVVALGRFPTATMLRRLLPSRSMARSLYRSCAASGSIRMPGSCRQPLTSPWYLSASPHSSPCSEISKFRSGVSDVLLTTQPLVERRAWQPTGKTSRSSSTTDGCWDTANTALLMASPSSTFMDIPVRGAIGRLLTAVTPLPS